MAQVFKDRSDLTNASSSKLLVEPTIRRQIQSLSCSVNACNRNYIMCGPRTRPLHFVRSTVVQSHKSTTDPFLNLSSMCASLDLIDMCNKLAVCVPLARCYHHHSEKIVIHVFLLFRHIINALNIRCGTELSIVVQLPNRLATFIIPSSSREVEQFLHATASLQTLESRTVMNSASMTTLKRIISFRNVGITPLGDHGIGVRFCR